MKKRRIFRGSDELTIFPFRAKILAVDQRHARVFTAPKMFGVTHTCLFFDIKGKKGLARIPRHTRVLPAGEGYGVTAYARLCQPMPATPPPTPSSNLDLF
jgi:hypothetical protein